MATQFKLSTARGNRAPSITVAAGDAVGTDTITVNFDVTAMTQGDALQCMDELRRKMLEMKWPPL